MNFAIGPLLDKGQSKDIPGWKTVYKRSLLSSPEYVTICFFVDSIDIMGSIDNIKSKYKVPEDSVVQNKF